MLFMFLDLGEVVLYRGCPMRPSSTLPSLALPPKGQRPALPRVASKLLLQTRFYRLLNSSFLVSGIYPLVRGAGPWPSGRHGHVKGHV